MRSPAPCPPLAADALPEGPRFGAMRRRGERAKAEEEAKSVGRKSEQGTESYQCTGLLEQDFPQLCARAGIAAPPKITPRPPPSFPPDEPPPAPSLPQLLAAIEGTFGPLQPQIQVERDQEDPQGVRALFLRGWKMEQEMLGVLTQILPPLSGLQALHLWRVGLSERLLPALGALLERCPQLRTLSLEGTPLPLLAIPTLMGGDSSLTHLSLRHSDLGDGGAQLVGQNLAPPNCRLVSLLLSFNHISDQGAADIAQGLRFNRSLLSLSLANNDIGDSGATSLAQILAPFSLTHAEVVERRRMLLGRSLMILRANERQSEHRSSLRSVGGGPDKLLPHKLGKTPAKKKEAPRKEEARQPRKAPEPRGTRSRDRRPSGQEKLSPEVSDPGGDPLHPLLEEPREQQGSLVVPGNRVLLNLNLSYNRITPRGLGAFVAALEGQQRGRDPKGPGQEGLRRLNLQRNRIPPSCPGLGRLRDLLPPPEAPPAAPQDQQEPAP